MITKCIQYNWYWVCLLYCSSKIKIKRVTEEHVEFGGGYHIIFEPVNIPIQHKSPLKYPVKIEFNFDEIEQICEVVAYSYSLSRRQSYGH